MPVAHANGGHLHYQIEGPGNAPALVLSNSLGTNFAMWDAQMPELRKHFHVLRYDTRGHGQSEVTPGPYSFEQLGRDVLALAEMCLRWRMKRISGAFRFADCRWAA